MNGRELRAKRVQAGISGAVLCGRARVDRARLSNIENEHTKASPSEIERLTTALNGLIDAKSKVISYAGECGWPMSAL